VRGRWFIDAIRFVPQSRPRLFIVAVRQKMPVPPKLYLKYPNAAWHPPPSEKAYAALPKRIQDHWMWWNLT